MNCFDSEVSFVNMYKHMIRIRAIRNAMKEIRTGAKSLLYLVPILYMLLFGARYVHCVTDET